MSEAGNAPDHQHQSKIVGLFVRKASANLPESRICPLMFGAELHLAIEHDVPICFPILAPVTFSNRLAPSEVRLKLTAGLPNSSVLDFVFQVSPGDGSNFVQRVPLLELT